MSDILKAIREGEQNAKAKERAKRRGAKAGGGSGGGGKYKSKNKFTRAEGRASLNRGGRGIAIQNQKSVKGGKGLKGVIDYSLNPEKSPELIYSNCGQDAKSILKTMQKFASLRPDITQENQVGHITLSLPPRAGKADSKLWAEMIKTAREKLGIDDSFACVAVRHGDRDHDHLHLIFCRINVLGKVHDKANIGLRCVATEALLEKKFSLEMVPEAEFQSRGHISKGEVEKGLRTQKLPPRLQIAAALKIAIQGKPNVQQFIERLNAGGIGVKANIASTGKMNGFSFVYEGIAFSGSKISKEFGWQSLQKELNYDQNRDVEYLFGLDGGTGSASADIANATSVINGINHAVASVSASTTDNSRNSEGNPPAPHRASELPDITKPKAVSRVATATTATPGRTQVPGNGMHRRADGLHTGRSRVSKAVTLITPVDLKSARWMRSSRLVLDYRQGLKLKTDIAELDRSAAAAGHDPADIVSAHATVTDKLPAEIAQDVLQAVPTTEMREYIEREFKTAQKRFNDDHTNTVDPNQVGNETWKFS
jgi:hypothetical protein